MGGKTPKNVSMAGAEAGHDDAVAKKWTLVAVILASGMVFLDSTVVNVALKQIGTDLSSSWFGVYEAQNYIYYGYLLTLSSLLILAGALNDFYGRRRMFNYGLIGFAATSVLCGLAPNMELLILFRLLQGTAGALLVPGSLSIITATFSGEEQGRAFGVWAGASGATTILGPVLGGALVAYVSWRAAFFINVPLAAIAVWATVTHMKETRDEESTGRFDRLGAAVVALAVGGLTFGTIRGEAQNWEDPSAFISLGIGAIASIALPVLMLRRPDPLVPPELFKSRNFTITNISTLIIYGALYVTFQVQAIFLLGTTGYNELAFGLAGLPAPLFLVFLSTRFGKLSARYGPRRFMTAGPALMGLGLLWLIRFPSDSEPWRPAGSDLGSLVPPADYFVDLLPSLVLFGLGLALMVAPLTTALMTSVPVRNSGVASAINNAISRVGPQLVGALLFIAITTSFYAGMNDRLSGIDTFSETFREQVTPLNPPPEGARPEVVRASQESSTDAFQLAMLVAAMLCFAGAAVNATGIKDPHREEAGETAAAPAAAG